MFCVVELLYLWLAGRHTQAKFFSQLCAVVVVVVAVVCQVSRRDSDACNAGGVCVSRAPGSESFSYTFVRVSSQRTANDRGTTFITWPARNVIMRPESCAFSLIEH